MTNNMFVTCFLPLWLNEGIGGHGILAIVLGRVSGQHPPNQSIVLLQYGPSESRIKLKPLVYMLQVCKV